MPRRPRTQYLFSYGSNNPQQLSNRLEYQVRGAEAAYADGWERVFRGYSQNWGGGVASLRRKSGSRTFGYIAPVTEEDLEILDVYEGVRSGKYKRQKVKVTTGDGQKIQAVAYISRSLEFNDPTQRYLRATAKTIGQFWKGSGGRVKVSDIPIRNPKRTGKYADVWNEYGQKGFGIPTRAPHKGSYPLYPEYRAKFALVLIAGPAYDKKRGERAQIAKRAIAAHPSLESFWEEREKTIKARMDGKGKSRMAANPSNVKYVYALLEESPPPASAYKSRRSLQRHVISLLRRDGNKSFFRADPDMVESVNTVVDDYMESPRLLDNPLTPKHVLVRAGSESELIELIPIAEEALRALGATNVKVQPIQNIHEGEYTALFIVEGLGEGKRWSSTQKKQFRRLVSAFLPSQIREPNFQNASSVLDPRDLEKVQASVYAREYEVGMKTPDSKRTRRAKARSKARRKLTRRSNPRR